MGFCAKAPAHEHNKQMLKIIFFIAIKIKEQSILREISNRKNIISKSLSFIIPHPLWC
jgi:hypothetical protein